jgi:hypothetical protein
MSPCLPTDTERTRSPIAAPFVTETVRYLATDILCCRLPRLNISRIRPIE